MKERQGIFSSMKPWAVRVGVVAATAIAWGGPVGAQEPLGVLNLEEVRSLTLENHPVLARSAAHIEAAQARVDQVGAALRPNVGARAGLDFGALPPTKIDENPDLRFEAGISAEWKIWDFGKTSAQQEALQAMVDAQGVGLEAIAHEVVHQAEQAFWVAKATAELIEVAQATLDAEIRHREEAERFMEAGTRAAIEVARAKTQEARARAELVQAETEARQALVQLGRAMGLKATPEGVEAAWPEARFDESLGAEALAEIAYTGRREIVAQRRVVEASEVAVKAADRGLLPFIGADAQVGVGSLSPMETWNPLWKIGVSVTWPIYDGGYTSGAVDAARAELTAAAVELEEMELEVFTAVSAAREKIISAKSEQAAADALVEAAEVELHIAEQRWSSGLGSGIELADAQTRLALASARKTTADLSLALARVQLSRVLDAR